MTTPRKAAPRGEVPGNLLTVQDAIYETVHNTAGLHAKALAPAMNVSHRDLLDIADPYRKRKLRAEEVPTLINATFLVSGVRCYLVLDVLERMVGRVAIPLPTVAADRRDDLEQAMRAIREFGEQQQRYVDVLQDGTVTEAEAATYEREADEAIAAIAAMKARVRSQVPAPQQLRSVTR